MAMNELTIHQHNIKSFTKEMFKFENDLFTLLNDAMLQVWKNNYNLRTFQKVVKNKKKLIKDGSGGITLSCISIVVYG